MCEDRLRERLAELRNVAVAWSAASVASSDYGDAIFAGEIPQRDIALWRERLGPSEERHLRLVCEAQDAGAEAKLLVSKTRRPTVVLLEIRAGLPFRCLGGTRWWEHRGRVERSYNNRGALGYGFAGTAYGFLPFRPIWPGFAVNMLSYAVVLWLLVGGPFALRRDLRIKRGLCPKCAYPMGKSSVCTECGKPLPRRRRMANLT